MRLGPRRSSNESPGAFRYRQALFCWPWVWSIAPVPVFATYFLRMGHGPLWWTAAIVSLLSGAVLVTAAMAGAALSLYAHWAGLKASPATTIRWHRPGFAISMLILVPAWLWSGYWTFFAIMQQHIIYGSWDNIVALRAEPQHFLLSLTAHAAMLITIPAYWMAQARKQAIHMELGHLFRPFDEAFLADDSRASSRRPTPQGIDTDER